MKRLWFTLRLALFLPSLILDGFKQREDSRELYHRFKYWAKKLMQLLGANVRLKRPDLIPLEDGYVFICRGEGNFDSLILASALPVRVNFVLEPKERIPVLNGWMKRLGVYRNGVRGLCDPTEFENLEGLLKHSENLVFFIGTPAAIEVGSELLAYAYAKQKTLIPVRIEGSSNLLTQLKPLNVDVSIGLPLHFEEYGEDPFEKTLAEITGRTHP